MEGKKSNVITAIILGICIIASTVGSTYLFTNYKLISNNSVSATGSAEMDFTSDLVVWNGSFTEKAETLSEGYDSIKNDKKIVDEYLKKNGFIDDEIKYSSVDINEERKSEYDEKGNWIGDIFTGYRFFQNVTITSKDLDKVDKILSDISSLLEAGVAYTTSSPQYYCTKLGDVKLDLIEKATQNAKERIDIMVKNSGAVLGKLKTSRLGVFQIVAKNSGTQNYAYDGYFDTSSREKTANITVRLDYFTK